LRRRGDPHFERTAARWLGRLLLKTPATLRDARFAVVLRRAAPASTTT
jgi:hypothetical protein